MPVRNYFKAMPLIASLGRMRLLMRTKSRNGARTIAKRKLHLHHIHPAAQFEAGGGQETGALESNSCMQSDGSVVTAVANHCHHFAVAALFCGSDQGLQKRCPDALPRQSRPDINGIFQSPAITGPASCAR